MHANYSYKYIIMGSFKSSRDIQKKEGGPDNITVFCLLTKIKCLNMLYSLRRAYTNSATCLQLVCD